MNPAGIRHLFHGALQYSQYLFVFFWQLSIVQVGLHSEVPLETKTGRCGAATRLAGQWIFRALGKPGASNVLRLLSEQSKASSLSSGGIES